MNFGGDRTPYCLAIFFLFNTNTLNNRSKKMAATVYERDNCTVDIFTFPQLNVLQLGVVLRGEGATQWTLVWDIFGQKQTDAFS